MAYNNTIDYLYQLKWHGIRPGLARMASLLSLLDHPQEKFRTVHIGGTNGKGSTATMTASILEASGYRVGLYTSPHLIDFSERICICGIPISHEVIVQLTEKIRQTIQNQSPQLSTKVTFFEFTTALAFLYFAEEAVDIGIIEVGMGGRFDATNHLKPLVTAITEIDLDHEHYLGTSLLEIATEKAGIIKKGVPLITCSEQAEVAKLFKKVSEDKKAPLIRLGQEIQGLAVPASATSPAQNGEQKMHYRGIKDYLIELPLLGRHQINNASMAIGIVESLNKQGLSISETGILKGIKKVRLSGRLEVVQNVPRILLDVAHNSASAKRLADYLQETDGNTLGKRWMIIGIMQDKNIEAFLKPLLACTDELVLTRPDIERAATPEMIANIVEQLCRTDAKSNPIQIRLLEKVSESISYVKSHIQPQDRLVITGSFFTVGEAKTALSETSDPIKVHSTSS